MLVRFLSMRIHPASAATTLALAIGMAGSTGAAQTAPRVEISYGNEILESLPAQWGGAYMFVDILPPPGWSIDLNAFPPAAQDVKDSDSVLVVLGASIASDSLAYGPWQKGYSSRPYKVGNEMVCPQGMRARTWFQTGFDFAMPGRNGEDSSAYPRAQARLSYRPCRPAGCEAPRTLVVERYGGKPIVTRIENPTDADLRSTPPIRFLQGGFLRVNDSLSGVTLDSLLFRFTVHMNSGWRIVAAADGDTSLGPPAVEAETDDSPFGYYRSAPFAFAPPRYPRSVAIASPRGMGTIQVFDSVFQVDLVPQLPQQELKYRGRSSQSKYPDVTARFRYQACNGPVCLAPKTALLHYETWMTMEPHGNFDAEEPFRPIQVPHKRSRDDAFGRRKWEWGRFWSGLWYEWEHR